MRCAKYDYEKDERWKTKEERREEGRKKGRKEELVHFEDDVIEISLQMRLRDGVLAQRLRMIHHPRILEKTLLRDSHPHRSIRRDGAQKGSEHLWLGEVWC